MILLVYWMKGERDFQISGGRTTVETQENFHQFTRMPSRTRDDGEYTVIAQNTYGKETAIVNVKVIPNPDAPKDDIFSDDDVPVPTKKPKKEKAPAKVPGPPSGEPHAFNIGCNSLRLKWGRPLEDGGNPVEEYRIESRTPDSRDWIEIGLSESTEFDVRNLKQGKEYLFRVSARNKVDYGLPSDMKHPIKTLTVSEKPVLKKTFSSETRIDEGQILTLEVQMEGKPMPSVRWVKDNLEIEESNKVSVSFEKSGKCKLTIKNVEANIDDGTYVCQIENEAGHASASTNLIVVSAMEIEPPPSPSLDSKKAASSKKAPEVVQALKNQTVKVAQLVKMTCRIPCTPKGKISWYHNGASMKAEGRVELQVSRHGACRLILHDAMITDSGTYKVVVQNKSGSAQSECELTVLEAKLEVGPKFEEIFKDQTVTAGSEVTFKCRVTGEPDPNVVWMKDGQKVKTTRHSKLGFTENGWCSLTIHSCIPADTGVYMCSAHNVIGTQSIEAMLTVVEDSKDTKRAGKVPAEGKGKEPPTKKPKTAPPSKGAKKQAPKFVKTPGDRMDVLEGQTVELVCRVIANPPANFLWKKDYKAVSAFEHIGS